MNGSSNKARALIDLLKGWPNSTLLPALQIEKAASIALCNADVSTPGLSYGPDPGYGPLREHIADWLTQFYKPSSEIPAERICVIGGASQNLACILQVFSDPLFTRNVWMVSPTYFLACRIFEDSGFHGRLRSVPEDEDGIDIEYLRKGLHLSEMKARAEGNTQPTLKPTRPWSKIYRHLIYAVPTFSNPSSRTMSLKRRQELVQVAREYDACIITDDVYDMLQWPKYKTATQPSSVMPRLVDIDRTLDGGAERQGSDGFGNAVSNGSFSKIAGPGCRTGRLEGTKKFAWGNSQVGSSRSGGAPSQLTATFMSSLIESGDLQRHIFQTLQPTYARRYRSMISAIEEHLLPLGVTLPQTSRDVTDVVGGYFIWLSLPAPMQAEEVAMRARQEKNLIIAPGPIFAVYGDEKAVALERKVRVCFSYEHEAMLAEGIQRLAQVIDSMQRDQRQQEKTTRPAPGESSFLVEQYR